MKKKKTGKTVRKRMNKRATIVLAAFLACLAVIGGRVCYYKLVKGAEYENSAKIQQVSRYDVSISPNRGSILDRNQQAMAVSTTVYNVVLDVRVLVQFEEKEQQKTIHALSEVLGLDLSELQHYISINPATQKPNADTNWKILATKQERTVKETLEAMEIKGVVYQKDTKRSYVTGTAASQVIGFIRGDTSWGLESLYNKELTGSNGRSFITYEGTNQVVTQEVDALDGHTLITTLDYTIQQYAEQAVDYAMETYGPENASAIVTNPKTGEVLAMAASPDFDPNEPSRPTALADEEFAAQWTTLTEEEMYTYLNNTWKNFNVSSSFEPGSIVKPMVMAAALEEGVVKAEDVFYCSGSKTVAGIPIGCWYRSGHGELDCEGVLSNSCNVGMMNVGERMGAETLSKYLREFGFASLTGIDLPNETSAASLMYDADEMGPTELATMSFGQSFNATPIQAITAFNALINGGNLMRPYVVSQVLDESGNVLSETTPELVRKVVSESTADTVRKMLQETMTEGTGKKAYIDGYAVGGKTGTAQQGDRSLGIHTLTFIAYLPVEDPEISIMVTIHRPPEYIDGVTSAAPMMKMLLENIIKYKAIEPSYEADPENISKNSGKATIDDFTGQRLFDVLQNLDYLSMNAEIVGSGNTVVNQVPHGGTIVEEGTTVILYVEKSEEDAGTVPVPDVKGKSYDEAAALLTKAGLGVLIKGESTAGSVVEQSPREGVSIAKGSDVTLTMVAPVVEVPAVSE